MAEHSIIQETKAFITKQRETLLKEREVIFAEQQALQVRLTTVNDALAKFDVFEGKPARASTRQLQKSPGGRRTGIRDDVLKVVSDNPGGLTRGGILEKMGAKDDKSAAASVSQALTALSKANKVTKDGRTYRAA
jgi:hypothetical protein